eukprot:7017245-Prymnesium_polylepis.1
MSAAQVWTRGRRQEGAKPLRSRGRPLRRGGQELKPLERLECVCACRAATGAAIIWQSLVATPKQPPTDHCSAREGKAVDLKCKRSS